MKGIQALMTTGGRETAKLHTATSFSILSSSSCDIQKLNAEEKAYSPNSTYLFELGQKTMFLRSIFTFWRTS
jgi:hypothetical protein